MFAERDKWLMSQFRLPRHVVLDLCQQLEPHLANETRRSSALPVRVRVNSRLGSSWPPIIEEVRLSADRRCLVASRPDHLFLT